MSRELTEVRVRELAREEIRAAAQPVASKPVAGEWYADDASDPEGDVKRDAGGSSDPLVAYVFLNGYGKWDWVIHLAVPASRAVAQGCSGTRDAAMLAADAWARDNAHLLDWTLPPAPVQPVAPRELTEAEIATWTPAEQVAFAAWNADIHDDFKWTARRQISPVWVEGAQPYLEGRLGRYGAGGDAIGRGLAHETAIAKAAEIRARPPAVPQPAPGATVDEVLDGLLRRALVDGIVEDRLRAALSTLSPAQLHGMVDAIGGGK